MSLYLALGYAGSVMLAAVLAVDLLTDIPPLRRHKPRSMPLWYLAPGSLLAATEFARTDSLVQGDLARWGPLIAAGYCLYVAVRGAWLAWPMPWGRGKPDGTESVP